MMLLPIQPKILSSRQLGFTLIETVAVIILIGILSAVVLPRLSGVSIYQNASLRSAIIGGLRLGQKTALSQQDTTIYWVLQRLGTSHWRISLLQDTDLNNSANIPTDITPSQLQSNLKAPTNLSSKIKLATNSNYKNSLAVGDNLVVQFDSQGNMQNFKINVNLNQATSFPNTGSNVRGSLEFVDNQGKFCLSLAGYSYEAACR